MADFVLHGAVLFSEDRKTLREYDDAYVVCRDGLCEGVYEVLPHEFRELPVEDFWDKLIIPGLTDLHAHAPQFSFSGLYGDMELLDWLNNVTFPEEEKYADIHYAERAYDFFAERLYIGATARAVIFGTIHTRATLRLMDILEETGLVTYVGKVNMDREAPDSYRETTETSLADTREWLRRVKRRRYSRTYPILTPRFTLSCTDALMEGLGALAKEQDLPVQSHLSENRGEIELVSRLCPDSRFYGETYDRCGLFGSQGNTVMAHCVWSGEEEIRLMKENGVFVAHCPESNIRLRSGAAPVSRYLEEGLRVGLGSDVSGGADLSILSAMRSALWTSNLRWRLMDSGVRPLTFPEVFYMATMGGGEFFGNVGTFRKGYEFDAVVLDDENLVTMRELSPSERAERLMNLGDDRNVVGKYVRGQKLY